MDPRQALRSVRAWLAPQPEGPRVVALPEIGAVLGQRYELVRKLGAGAGAIVFHAHDRLLGVDVAIKVLLPDGIYVQTAAQSDGDLRAEARRCLGLTHPNIVRVYTYERDDHWEFLVMELVDGEDLVKFRARQPRQRVAPPETVRIGIACLDALAYAHEHGILHNDVKPGNILIDRRGSIRLCDFGLSRLAEAEVQRDLIAGSPVYMAPERIRGRAGDGRSDLYSLAATLYTILAGAPPFGREEDLAMAGHLAHDMPANDDIPAPLDRILRKAMAKQPEDRYGSARAMRDALAQYAETLHHEALLEVPVGDGQTSPPPIERGDAPKYAGAPAAPTLTARLQTPTPVRVSITPPPAARPAAGAAARTSTPAPPADTARPAAPAYAPTVRVHRAPPGMAWIPAATLDQGPRIVDVPGFFLDTTPVTNARFKAYLDATHDTPPSHWLGARVPRGKEEHPVVGVDLAQARRFAAWAGRRLPTESEWLSALHGAQGRAFPWGDGCDGHRCQCPRAGAGDTAPVGQRPNNASPDGVLDLLGNVWEWVDPDPRLPHPEAGRGVALGGSFKHACTDPGRPPRSEIDSAKAYLYLGFRCAVDEATP